MTDLEKDINFYKEKEKRVAENFLVGIMQLGGLLKKAKDKWKQKGKWTEYLENIGKSMAGANQFIRMYEYAKKHLAEIKNAELTNWSRVNSFLALPEELRLKLAEEIGGKEIEAKDFEKKMIAVRGKEVPESEMREEEEKENECLKTIVSILKKEYTKEKIDGFSKEEKKEKIVFLKEVKKTIDKILDRF